MIQQHIHPLADAPLADSLSLIQLLNLSLKTPDYGVVNFRSLYVLLEYLINRMNVAEDRVNLCERPSREFLREAARGMADGGARNMTNGVVDYRDGGRDEAEATRQEPFHTPSITSFSNQQRIAALEQKVGTLRMQLDAFNEFPTNERLAEKAEGLPGFTLNIFDPARGSLSLADQRALGVTDPTIPIRSSGPMIEAWQMVQLGKRMDAAEQALEKAFSLIDDILQGLGKIKNLKDNLVNYIRKWMLNPDAASQDALTGDILGDNNTENFTVPPQVTKLPFVTWPALRSVLVDRQNEDAKASMAAGGQRSRSPSNSVRSLSPITEKREGAAVGPLVTDDQTSARSEEERNRISVGTSRYPKSPESALFGASPQPRTDSAVPPVETEEARQPRKSSNEQEISENVARGEIISPGENSDGAVSSDDEVSPKRRDTDGSESQGSQKRSDSTRRSTPLPMTSASEPKTPTLDEMLTGSPHLSSPTFVSDPDVDVLDSLIEIGRLVRISRRFEKRLARIEAYLNGLAHKKDMNRLSQGLRSDMDEFRKSLSSVIGAPGWPGTDGQQTIGNGFDSSLDSPDNEVGQNEGSQLRGREGTDLSGGSPPFSADHPGQRNPSDTMGGSISPDGTATGSVTNRPGSAGTPGTWVGGGSASPALSPLSGLDLAFKPVSSGEGQELAAVTTRLKEQSAKMAGTSSRIMIQPQLDQDSKQERTTGQASNGPKRSEFEIFCRACAENFEMVEIRLTDLEHIMRTQQAKLEALQFQVTRLQCDKADEITVAKLLPPKADAVLLDNKLDKAHFMEYANLLQQKIMDIRGNIRQQGDFLGNHIRTLAERLETQLDSGQTDQKIEDAQKHLDLMNRRIMLLEKLLEMDSAAGSKKPIRAYTCVSCDKPVDPTPNEKPSGWPHAYVTPSVRPHLEYMKHQMIDNWDGNQHIGELKYKHMSLNRRFQRHLREQECIEWKDASNHFGNSSFPHCNHHGTRPSGGKHTQLNNHNYQSAKTNKRCIEDRLDSFVRKNSLQIQLPRPAKDGGVPYNRDIPGFPDITIGPLRKPRSADSLSGKELNRRGRPGCDTRHLKPGIQRRTGTVPPLAIELRKHPSPAKPTADPVTVPPTAVLPDTTETLALVDHAPQITVDLESITVPRDTMFASDNIDAAESSISVNDFPAPAEIS